MKAGTFVPHTVPFTRLRNVQDATNLRLLMEQPRPEAKAAGMKAWYRGETLASNPNPVGSAEFAGWESGWLQTDRGHQ